MKVLAVDDNSLSLTMLTEQIRQALPDADIRSEEEPEAALAWAQELSDQGQRLDYAFLDIQLTSMDGLELAWRLKKIFPRLELFFCTSYEEYAIHAFGLRAKGYLLKPVRAADIRAVLDEELGEWRSEKIADAIHVRVQTFGNFDVFVDGKLITFERRKAKEMLAYLVDRHGSSVTTEQMAAVLYEDENYDKKLKSRVTSAASSLQNTLRENGVEDILVKTWGRMAIDTEKIKCDAYDFEKGDMLAVNSFHGEYMLGYSWAEFTTGKYVSMEMDKNRKRN